MTDITPYKAYKPTGLPWLTQVPEHWGLRRFKYLFKEINQRSEFGDEDLLSVSQYTGVTKRRDNIDESENLTNASTLEGYKKVEQGDLVINIMLAWNGSLGISNYAGIVSPAYCVYRNSQYAHPAYFHYLLRTDLLKGEYKKVSSGVVDSRLRMYTDDFFALYTILPPLSEQIAIADFLDHKTAKIDTAISKKQQLIELLKEQKQKFLDEIMFGESSQYIRLKHLSTTISKGTTPSTEGESFTDSGIRYIKAENITADGVSNNPTYYISESTHEILKRSKLLANDILFVIAGATLGKCAILSNDLVPANTNQAVSFIRLKKNQNHKFILNYLQTTYIKDLIWLEAVQSAQPNLSMTKLSNFAIYYPSRERQAEIVVHIESESQKIDTTISRIKQEIEYLREYRTTLIASAVTGKINVQEKTYVH